jgi:LemA protein
MAIAAARAAGWQTPWRLANRNSSMGLNPWVWVVAAAIAIAVIAVVRTFNRLIAARNGCANSRASIDAQLMRRHDLVPPLVEVVAGYAAHERAVMRVVADARTAAVAQLGAASSAGAEARLDEALGALHVRIEAYPELKASANFLHLQRTLTEIEEQISAARRAFNAHVAAFNNLIEQFPTLVVARLCGFATADFFEAAASERGVPSPAIRSAAPG